MTTSQRLFKTEVLGLLLICVMTSASVARQDDHSLLDKSFAADWSTAHECDGCHGTHGPAADPTKGTPEEVDLLCLSCHGPAGISVLKADVHSTRNGVHNCLDCHNPHADPDNWLGDNNQKLVGSIDYESWPWLAKVRSPLIGEREVVFESRGPAHDEPSLHSFADSDEDGNGYFDGPCESCHTQTAHHRNDTPDLTHETGTTCTSCHTHDNGFLPSGGGDCTSCHAGPQGSRRAVVGEFPVGDAHAHYGGELDSADCVVCHDQTTHQDGYVDLIDPDDGSIYRFIQPEDLMSDPDLSTFCARCHDADGALNLSDPLDPFGEGNAPHDVYSKFQGTLQWDEWYGDSCFGTEGTLRGVNSHHDVFDADQLFSGAKIECLNCHGAHNSSLSQPLADPFDTTIPWAGTSNDFCLSCHNGGSGPLDPGFPPGIIGPAIEMRGIDSCGYVSAPWHVDYAWTNVAHGPDTKRDWAGYSGAPFHELNCLDCHDQHGSVTPTNPAGNPYMIRDVVDGTAYVDDGVRPGGLWTGPPWDTFGTSREVVVPINGVQVDWGSSTSLCSVCHFNWENAYSWHSFCDGCQTCHGHGQAWGNHDWGPEPLDSSPCPLPPASYLKSFYGLDEVDLDGLRLHGATPDGVISPQFSPRVTTHPLKPRSSGRERPSPRRGGGER